ncbi:hypothetical protein HDV05_006247 [Chytridiales sp. JEL 0842]|nr:hypothetical protein HDV05_006247 [Chytridiales sp. JEL 0842]
MIISPPTSLPPEVLQEILSYFRLDIDALKTLGRVCKAWRPHVAAILFRTLQISAQPKLPSAQLCLTKSSTLASSIQELRFDFLRDYMDGITELSPIVNMVASIAESCSMLRQVVLQVFDDNRHMANSKRAGAQHWKHLASAPNLESLRVRMDDHTHPEIGPPSSFNFFAKHTDITIWNNGYLPLLENPTTPDWWSNLQCLRMKDLGTAETRKSGIRFVQKNLQNLRGLRILEIPLVGWEDSALADEFLKKLHILGYSRGEGEHFKMAARDRGIVLTGPADDS